jgi:iron complex transport system substrate-binding protein
VLTEPRVSVDGTSGEIHAQIEEAVRDGLAVYRVRTDHLRTASPDLIVTQDQCRVCAVSLEDVERATREVLGHGVRIVSLRTSCLAELWEDIRHVADAAGVPARGAALVDELQHRMQTIRERASRAGFRPRVACIEWIEPLMLAGNWVPELVAVAGGATGDLVCAGTHSTWGDWAALAAYAPEVIVVAPCGFTIEDTLRDAPVLARQSGWAELPAVVSGRVFAIDGSAYLNRPGPRLVDTAEILAHLLHPATFPDAPSEGWRRLTHDDFEART